MAHSFTVRGAALRRSFAVYLVVARLGREALLYVGKTGDNRLGCNPMISRCGNHFSYNNIHSQIRNKIPDHERWTYTYVFDHFDPYLVDKGHRTRVDRINEMERWLNKLVQREIVGQPHVRLLNPHKGPMLPTAHSSASALRKLRAIVADARQAWQ
jgi:hypothetical protein